MKTKDRDIQSYIHIVDSFIDQASLEKTQAELIKKELKKYISIRFERKKWVHPEITKFCTDWYREFYRMIDGKDPYKELKEKSNEKALEIKQKVKINTFEEAVAAGIIGNKIDYGAALVHKVDLNTLEKEFSDIHNFAYSINDMTKLKEKIKDAKTILFLADNDGEIIFDTFLLEILTEKVGKANLFIMGKESPMLNDVTVQDLKELRFERYGTIVSTGSNCFGLHIEDVSQECKDLLENVDLVIAKGQAYFEFFTEYNFPNIINLLRVKYPITGPGFGTIPSGENVIISSERYAKYGKKYQRTKVQAYA
ncbi:DUF89 family protein [Candidatus Woesearchaeota archaeon]|nr:DUF89 family protein [Candidatus Woesearchaeota archaeon]